VILLKKALRSIWRGKRSYAACIALIALGVASYVGFTLTSIQLLATLDSMYETQQFGDAFATVGGISQANAASLARIEGIRQVTARTTADVTVLHDGDASLTLYVLSYDENDDAPLSRFLILEGEAPGRGEILLSNNFFTAQGLSLGDTISILSDGKQLRPVISGVAISPEYTSEVGEGMTGDGFSSGYAYMPEAEVSTLAKSDGLANHLTFLLEEGVDYKDIEPLLEDSLGRYGLKSLYGREDHPGHYSTWISFASLSSTAGMISFIFLTVAILVLYILLRRVIEQERTQIGTLKAFGLSGGKILLLYLGYGGVTGFTGGLIGVLAGLGIAKWFSGIYLTVLFMPAVPMVTDIPLLITAMALSVGAGLAGAAMGARRILALSPAEAMRPAAPTMMKKKKPRESAAVLPPAISMALRGITRSKFRSGFVAGGMAFSFSVLVFMSSYGSIMTDMVMVQFEKIQLYDMKLSLKEPRSFTQAVQSAGAVPEIEAAEGILELSVEIYHDHLHTDAALTGLDQNSEMRRIYDSSELKYLPVPEQGATISRPLADKLAARVGDTLEIVAAPTGDKRLPVTVTGIVGENMGSSAYMELGQLCGLLGGDKTVNSLLLKTSDPPAVKTLLAEAKNVDTLSDQQELRQATQTSLDSTYGVNVGIFSIIGLGIAFAIIASSASISLSERSREYATLRVLGMSPGEIGKIMVFEYLLLTVAGFMPGIPMAVGLRSLLMLAMGSVDGAPSFSPAIAPVHFVVGAAICLITVAIANISSIRQIARLEMTDVLKERE